MTQSVAISSLISLITTLLITILSSFTFLETYELKSLDFFQRLNPSLRDPKVALVEVNQRSLNVLSEQGIHWPWPRQMYAPIVEFCSHSGAEAIIFDIIFSEPSSYGEEDDLMLKSAIEKAQNVYMPISLSKTEEYQADIRSIERFGISSSGSGPICKGAKSYIPPFREFSKAVKGLGDVMVEPDRDGVYRRINLFTKFEEYFFPTLAVAPLLERFSLNEKGIQFDDMKIDTKGNADFLLFYYGKNYQFPRINALEVLSAYQDPNNDIAYRLTETIRGRFIIIGLTAPGLYDLKPSPVTSVSPGAYIHATMLTNLLNKHHIRQIERTWKLALMFVCGTILGLSIIRVFSFWKNILIALLFILGLPVASFILFHVYLYWAGIFSYEVSSLMVIGITSTYRYNTEGKKRRIIRRLFSRYMSEPLVRELEENPQKARLGGEKRFITIFFSDLVNFTGLSEQFEPEEIVRLLNNYFTEMSQIILDLRGIIDKYQGDGIMAFWGAPIPEHEHGELACLAALRCQRKMREIRNELLEDRTIPISMRIGLHSGEAVVGNMGSTQRFDYTIIGDNVNLASRLEGVNTQYGTDVIVSEVTYQLAKEKIEARELDLITVKGKEQPIRIYQLLAERKALSEQDNRMKSLFEEGLRLYRDRAFEDARRCFENVLRKTPNDKAAHVFIERCSDFLKGPPPPDWDGVFRLTTK